MRLLLFVLILCVGCHQSSDHHTEFGAIPVVEIPTSDSTLTLTNDLLYQNKQLFSGYVVEKYENHRTATRKGYLHGKLEGKQEKWYPDGTKMEVRYYKDNRKTGKHLGWWPDGQQKFEYLIQDDIPIGQHREWHPNGQLYSLATYNNQGQPDGPQKMWYNTGQIKANYFIKNGRNYGFIGAKGCMGEGEKKQTGLR